MLDAALSFILSAIGEKPQVMGQTGCGREKSKLMAKNREKQIYYKRRNIIIY